MEEFARLSRLWSKLLGTAPGPRHRQRGSSLVEMMIAAMVFTVGALGLLRLIYSSAEGLGTASKVTYATTLCTSKLDQLMAEPFDSALLNTGAHEDGPKNLGPYGTPFDPHSNDTGDFGAADGWFVRSWTVVEQSAAFKTINVEVAWTEPNSSTARTVNIVGARSRQ